MLWHELTNEVDAILIRFNRDERNDVVTEVKLLSVTGEPLVLNELSLSSQPLPHKTDCVVSVTLGMQALTLLLSSWTENATRTIAGQPKMLTHFLTVSERIIRIWESIEQSVLDEAQTRKRWHR